jgi:hypothetical protein
LPAHDIEQAVIGAAVRALGNRALLIERVGVSDASADQIRALLDSAGRIAAMVEKSSWSSSRRKRQAGVLRRVERGQHGHGGIISRRVRFRFAPHDDSSRDPLALSERRSRRFAHRDGGPRFVKQGR